jgi:hypothetical protein
MQTIEVQVSPDHLDRIANTSKPIDAILELIWNGLDADAENVEVQMVEDKFGQIDLVEVRDDGSGISPADASQAFKNLGGSGKQFRRKTPKGRMMHGRQGKGRFKSFGIGNQVDWLVRYKDKESSNVLEYLIQGSRNNLKRFKIGEPKITSQTTGTIVKISQIENSMISLKGDKAIQKLTEEFALYLRQYPDAKIKYNNHFLKSSDLENSYHEFPLEDILISQDRKIDVNLTIIEWKINSERAMYFCDSEGFTLQRTMVGIKAPGFNFTAYLSSDHFRDLSISGDLAVEEIHPDLAPVLKVAREKMREYFRERSAERVSEIVEAWKNDSIYPYENAPKNSIEKVEQQIFDVVAFNVHEYLPDFQAASTTNKKFQFRLLKTAIESSPNAVQSIIKDVLCLPTEKQEELAEILEKTSLESIINAAKIVSDRLDFLHGLELLVFEPDSVKKTLERQHLHKIVAEHTWIFGEEYHLAASDRSLTNVLKRHLDLTNRELLDHSPVVREDGTQGIVDLMLSRKIPQPNTDQNHHLIIELKRPKVNIGNVEVNQVEEYAYAIINDQRFKNTKTNWDFWAVSNEISETVRMKINQPNRPEGLIVHNEEHNMKIWVKTWGQIIDASRAKLQFFKDHLNYSASDESGLEYLQKVHGKYLPSHLSQIE